MASSPTSTGESALEHPMQRDSTMTDCDPQSSIEREFSTIEALDHLEATLLLKESEVVVDKAAPSGLQQRANRLGWAMDAAASLCRLGDDVDVTVTVGFAPVEVATLVLAHVVAASTYRSEGVPDTAAPYEQRAVQLLGSLAGHCDN